MAVNAKAALQELQTGACPAPSALHPAPCTQRPGCRAAPHPNINTPCTRTIKSEGVLHVAPSGKGVATRAGTCWSQTLSLPGLSRDPAAQRV